METLPADELRTVQAHRLSWQVQRCWDGSRFHRERLEAAGVEPDDVRSLADLARLPLLTTAELAAEQQAHPSFGRLAAVPPSWLRDRSPVDAAAAGAAAGPTEPFASLWTQADVVHRSGLAARALWSCGARPRSQLWNLLSPGSIESAAIADGGHKLGLAVAAAPGLRDPEGLPASRSDAKLVVVTQGAAPDQIDLPVAIRGRAVVVAHSKGAEIESENDGGQTEAAVEPGPARAPTRPFLMYGSDQLGPTLAVECEARAGLHWAEDHFLVEVLDPATLGAAAEGEVGWLVVTHLTREATPLLRFWTGHRARVLREPCPCGRTHARSPEVMNGPGVGPP